MGQTKMEAPERPSGGDSMTSQPLVCIALATYHPQPTFFEKQIASLIAQRYENWVAVVQDDSIDPEVSRYIQSVLTHKDPEGSRFSFEANPARLGVYGNFERALNRLPNGTELIALCDQDDIWHPDKLTTLVPVFSSPAVMLVHSDMRIIDEQDNLLSASCWDLENRNPGNQSLSLQILRNSVTGCSAIFRRQIIELALPFPVRAPNERFLHDAWLATIALALGEIVPISAPLIDYRFHDRNQIGPGIGSGQLVRFKDFRPWEMLVVRCLRWLRSCQRDWRARRRLWLEMKTRSGRLPSRPDRSLLQTYPWFNGVPDLGIQTMILAALAARSGHCNFSQGMRIAWGKLADDIFLRFNGTPKWFGRFFPNDKSTSDNRCSGRPEGHPVVTRSPNPNVGNEIQQPT